MTWQIAALWLLLAVMAYLFLTAKLPVDLTAFLGLVALILAGYVDPTEAFSGFASPAVITMLGIFVISAALLYTGVADLVAARVHGLVGNREVPLIAVLMLVSGILSGFMNNIAATAVLMPAVAGIARRSGLSPSRLMMPLAFGSILGGTTTMVGTPPNIVAAAIIAERGMAPFGLFDSTPIGLTLLLVGVLFMITLGRRLLPTRQVGHAESEVSALTHIYRLEDRLFTIRIPESSPLDRLTLMEANLSDTLHITVVSIMRGTKRFAPTADTRLRSGDVLLVEGTLSDLDHLLAVGKINLEPTSTRQMPRPVRGSTAIRFEILPLSDLVGRTPREARFRDHYGAVIVGVERRGDHRWDRLATFPLQAGDHVVAIGSRARLHRLHEEAGLQVESFGLAAMESFEGHLSVLRVPRGSTLAGQTVGSSRLSELAGVTVGGIIRGQSTLLDIQPEEVIEADDGLLVACEPARVEKLVLLGDLELDARVGENELDSENLGITEVSLAPRSVLQGRTPRQMRFRERYGLQLLAVWRDGRSIYEDLADLTLRFGDALLVQGPWDRIRLLGADPNFVVLSTAGLQPRRPTKAPIALGALGLMVAMVVLGLQPIHVAAFTAASLALLFGTVTMEEAYRAIEWRTIFLVAAVLPVGLAMESTGAALLLVDTVREVVGPLGNYAILIALVVLASLLSQALDGAPSVVLLAPVALETAAQLGMNPYAAMMGVSLAASVAFMTPFSHKANLLVMGAGGYRALDYARVGTPLTVVVLAILVVLVPVFFPL